MDSITSHSEGGAGDDEMVPCSPLAKHPCSEAERAKRGANGGERKIAATLGTNIIAGVVNNSYILPPCCPTGRP